MSYRFIYFDEKICNGCNICVDICPSDILAPNPEKGKPPIVMYPEECWFGGGCITHCPLKGAIEIVTPFPMRGGFQRIKE
jgi:NAD-dependent dihydropyrimidine dehydrogenase PreA subunit